MLYLYLAVILFIWQQAWFHSVSFSLSFHRVCWRRCIKKAAGFSPCPSGVPLPQPILTSRTWRPSRWVRHSIILKKAQPYWTKGTNHPPTPPWAGSRRREHCRRLWSLSESCSVGWLRDTHKWVSVISKDFPFFQWNCYLYWFYSVSELITFSFLSQTDYRGDDEWHRDQFSVQVEAHLRAELEESQKQLKCAHDAQQEQKNKMQSLRYSSTPSPQLGVLYKNRHCLFSVIGWNQLFVLLHHVSVTRCFHIRQPKGIKSNNRIVLSLGWLWKSVKKLWGGSRPESRSFSNNWSRREL